MRNLRHEVEYAQEQYEKLLEDEKWMGLDGMTKGMKKSRIYTISDAIHFTNMKKGDHDVSPFDFEKESLESEETEEKAEEEEPVTEQSQPKPEETGK